MLRLLSVSIQTTLVGSYPVPDWLRAHPTTQGLEDATRVVLSIQERAGIDLVTDGELSRFDLNHPETNGMIEYFVQPLAGVRSEITRDDLRVFAAQEHLGFRRCPAAVVEGELGEGTLDLVAAFRRARALARGRLKFTVTSPYMLGRMLLDRHYGDLPGLVMALARVLAAQIAEVDADVVQVDEANLPGNSGDCLLAAEAVNLVLDAVPGRPAVHLCFGNYGGNRIQEGRLAALRPFFEQLRADHVVLETARTDFADLDVLADMDNVRFGVGVIDVKDTATESPSQVARRLERAASILGGADRIAYVHPDCGFWMLARSIADGKIRALVAGRDLFSGTPNNDRGPSHVASATYAGQVLRLPTPDRGTVAYRVVGQFRYAAGGAPPRARVPYAAVHVVADPLVDTTPLSPAAIDWDRTLAFRRHIWSYGLGVAEAMDTAQRGMGLDWDGARELIRRSVAEARAVGGRIVCGAQTDHLAPGSARTLRDVEAAYEEQCQFVEAQGGQVVLMASRELARIARGPDDYRQVYDTVLGKLARPALVHWLGDMFDPQLAGYWGAADLDGAMDVLVDILTRHASRVEGLKLSLLDQRRELAMRRRLPDGVHMFTGDDFDYPTTIKGDGQRYSDALLGAFDAIAPAASAALLALDEGDCARFDAILEPTVPLSRHIFTAPTVYYKTGVVFLAFLNGHQEHFRMVGGLESGRSIQHLARLFVLADGAGLLREPDRAAQRMRSVLSVAGVDQG